MDDQVDPDVSQERFSRLVALQQQISLDKNEALLGTIVEVLTEGPSKKDPGMATARTRTNKVVHVPGRFEPGSFLRAAIERAAPSHLIGSVVP